MQKPSRFQNILFFRTFHRPSQSGVPPLQGRKHLIQRYIPPPKSPVGIAGAIVIMNMDMTNMPAQPLCPFQNRMLRKAMGMPDIQAQAKIWMADLLRHFQEAGILRIKL